MDHEQIMRRCLQLAEAGRSTVAPNPMVGSVILHEGIVIGEGYHTAFGKPHAEPEAINSVVDRTLLKNSVLYVNLEPCSHYGKTPPCADRIVKEGIPKVVIGSKDPNPLVAGKGIKILRDAGVEVIEGVLEEECRNFNSRFYTFHEKKRPYVILKWAQSSDGYIGRKEERVKISNAETSQLVHKWRSEEQAILVGKNTVMCDDPKLNVRHWQGRDPVRVVIDKDLELSSSFRIFSKDQRTVVINSIKEEQVSELSYVKVESITASSLLTSLYKLNINSVVIEGGAKTLEMFITEGFWDEARIITAELKLQNGISAPEFNFTPVLTEHSGKDTISYFVNSFV
jgi:diaminohydroxyphosphoribosylaminopyrimidine deaminase / 5-amino-6-(5-phosphoribosylamino)uracil reductase